MDDFTMAASLDEIVHQFNSYDDFLDSKITPRVMHYLEDRTMAKLLVEQGQWGSVPTREQFATRKVALSMLGNQHCAPKERKEVTDSFLKALAEREENNRTGILNNKSYVVGGCCSPQESVSRGGDARKRSIIFIRDRNAGGQLVSGFIDYAHRLQSEDFEAFFNGKKRLMPRKQDLSFYNWSTQTVKSNSSPNYEVISNQPPGMVFRNKMDQKILKFNPWVASHDNWTRTLVQSDLYVQAIVYDHKIQK